MVWASVLTHGTEWFEPVLWAAACHDLRREDDGADPDHGFRAGAWVRSPLSARLGRSRVTDLAAVRISTYLEADRGRRSLSGSSRSMNLTFPLIHHNNWTGRALRIGHMPHGVPRRDLAAGAIVS